jgi:tRNA A37 N6-isopentenylltransferase MiaA
MSRAQTIAQIQQATRHYAKRQLTWFRGQSSFEPLNLSLISHGKAVDWITEKARLLFRAGG